jgi:hypothetical protein
MPVTRLAKRRRSSLLACVGGVVCVVASCSRGNHSSAPAASENTVSARESGRVDAGPGRALSSSRSLGPSAPGSEPLESSVDKVQLEGRSGASVEQMCAAWKADLLAAVRSEHEAGFGFDNYDEGGIVCAGNTNLLPLEGELPHGWSILSSVELQYFDGVAHLDEQYLLLRRADGALVVGPKYSASNDIGDAAPPAAYRAAMVPVAGAMVLVLVSLEIGDRPDPLGADGYPGPNAHYQVVHSGRVCRFEVARFRCEPKGFTEFRRSSVSRFQHALLMRAPRVDLPELDVTTGKLREEPGSGT